jgi:hypothetical protein
MSESAVVSACIQWLHVHRCFIWRNNTGHWKDGKGNHIRYGLVGSSDIIGMTPSGRFLAVECKSEKGKLTPHQLAFMGKVLQHGGIFILARSIDDLEDRKAEIE